VALPNFLVIGAQRAGTTLLHRILEAHPGVFVPYRRKEVHYFDRYFDRGIQWYHGFFPPAGRAQDYKAIGEVTPDYMFEQEVPRRIFDTLPSCRFIVSLRNPVDRAYSAYLRSVRDYNERRSAERFFSADGETLQRGCYSIQLLRYFALFPREAFLVLIYEELITDPTSQLARITEFLDLDRNWDDPSALVSQQVNASFVPQFQAGFAYARRFGALLTRGDLDWVVRWAKRSGVLKLFGRRRVSKPLAEPTRRMLQEYYRNEVATLQSLLDRDLHAWWDGFR
jgi:hypothetical protein